MKYAVGVIALLSLLVLANAHAYAAECTDLAPFIQANALFTQAESAAPQKAHELWQQGEDVLRQHSEDVPSCSEQDQFDLVQLRALEHSLAVELAWSGTDAIKTGQTADAMWFNTMEHALYRRTYLDVAENVERYLQKRWGDLYEQAARYHEHVVAKGREALFALHSSSGPGCAQPSLKATPVDIVTPNFFPAGRDLGKQVTLLIEVSLDETGKITATRFLQQSGNRSVDAAALDAAKRTTYAPAVVNCKATAATYHFRLTFDPGG